VTCQHFPKRVICIEINSVIEVAMRPPRHSFLVEKAIHAALAAIEIYNKPGFRYREESFAILMLNAWELLPKARIVKENNKNIKSIEIWEPRKTKSGAPTKRLFPRKTVPATP
jgi:hypothetical protein